MPPPALLPSTKQISELRVREREMVTALAQRVTDAIDDMLPDARRRLFEANNLQGKLRFTVELEHDEPASIKVKVTVL